MLKKLKTPEKLRFLLGGYRKKLVFLHVTPKGVNLERRHNTASYWDGGSRTYYSVLTLATGIQSGAPTGSYPKFEASVKLEPGQVLMSSGTSMGKPATAAIHYHEEDQEAVYSFFGIQEAMVEDV